MTIKTKTHKFVHKLVAVMLSTLLIAFYIPVASVGAATTFVETLDDLKNIANNLDGDYVLAATIDCGGEVLEPIGNLKNPFTGTFTCPTSSDGKPKYAITNFAIDVSIDATSRANQNSMYQSDGDTQWCTGLFGATHNAYFENIVLLEAEVTSDVFGGSTMGSNYETYYGMDEQGTGIFAGVAVGTTFKNCGVEGMVAAVSNHVGGFVGQATNQVKSSGANTILLSSTNGCDFENCYAYVNANGGWNASMVLGQKCYQVQATDLYGWNFGGFAGSIADTELTGCFVDGYVACGTWMSMGGFVGGFDSASKINACYVTGIGDRLDGPFAGRHNGLPDICTVAEQCYSDLVLGGSALDVDSSTSNSNYVTATVGQHQYNASGTNRFSVCTVDKINSAFSTNDNWQTYADGVTLPTVKALAGKTIKTVSDLLLTSTTVMQPGVYNIRVTVNKTEHHYLTASEVIIIDELGDEIVYNERAGGWPLNRDTQYTISYNLNDQGYLNGNFFSNLVKKEQPIFPDTDANGWYYNAVIYSSGHGLVKGYENGYFGTADGIQRQDFLLILARACGADLDAYAGMRSQFPDVAAGSYYEAAVNWGYANGVTTGYENGRFGVGDLINREQLVTMLMRSLGFTEMDPNAFYQLELAAKAQYTDYHQVSDYAKESMLMALYVRFINGKSHNTLDPLGTAQRCEVAQIFYNMYLLAKETVA